MALDVFLLLLYLHVFSTFILPVDITKPLQKKGSG